MVRISEKVYVGTLEDYELNKSSENIYTIIAAKEPYHRRVVGYSGRACSKHHPEYLYAERERCLICNLVDVDDVNWISPVIIDKVFKNMSAALEKGMNVLICCNQGRSRSATIGMMYLHSIGVLEKDFETSEKEYRLIYPHYEPAKGIRDYARMHW